MNDTDGDKLAFWPVISPDSNGFVGVMSDAGECFTVYGESGMKLDAVHQAVYLAAALRILDGVPGVVSDWKKIRAKLILPEPASEPAPPKYTPAATPDEW